MRPIRSYLILFILAASTVNAVAQSLDSAFYDIGTPAVVDYYVNPNNGSDSADGRSRESARGTVTSIWNEIPQNQTLTQGVRINLLPGTYSSSHLPNYWENRRGTAQRPIIVRALDDSGVVKLSRDINMANVSYFYLLGVTIENEIDDGFGDAFHCERCDHTLLRGNSFNGAPRGRETGESVAHETVKFNQSSHVYIENNNIQGAYDNGIDWVGVQYGHIRGNRIHDTQGWCAYVKGGSSYVLIEGNLVYDCGEGGITAGQGTGFEFMTSPWIRYEANYIKIVNNVLHDIFGAALGVNGGYGVLIAHNTAFRVGARSHLLEIVHGSRSCDGNTSACTERQVLGGWGPTSPGDDTAQPIGNQDVIVANNLFYNPTGTASGFQHFAIHGPRVPTIPGIPSPQRTDTSLRLVGNVIWNGDLTMPLGIEGSEQGCQPDNTTCSETRLRNENTINVTEPDLLSPANGDYRPAANGRLSAITSASIDNHAVLDFALNPIPEGERTNQLRREFSGAQSTARPPGAFASHSSSLDFASPGADRDRPPSSDDPGQKPTLRIKRILKRIVAGRLALRIVASASDADGIRTVSASVHNGRKRVATISLLAKGTNYVGRVTVKRTSRLTLQVTATDNLGESTTRKRRL
jgi:hypothetical protein